MSHFSVAVLTKRKEDVEGLLAPYQENNMEDCPKEYLEFYECDKKEIEQYEKHKNEYKSLDGFMYDYYGYKLDKETGKYGYWENPNKKWDWYEIGGRWNNVLITKNNEKVNFAKLKNIDWNKINTEAYAEAIKIWDSNPQGIVRLSKGILEDDTKESFIKRYSTFAPYAIITPDGKWLAKGKMGWFGYSNEDKEKSRDWKSNFSKFIKSINQDLYFTIVDCHI